jgi:hypothetical protein
MVNKGNTEMAHIFTAPKGQKITLDDIAEKRPNAKFLDKAIVFHRGEYFIAEFICTQSHDYSWAIRHEYGFKSAFEALIECEGVTMTNGTWLRANHCIAVY